MSGKITPLVGGLDWPAFQVRELSIDSDGHVRLEGGFRDGDHYVITGRKWFTTGAMHAAVLIVVAVTDPEGPRHRRVSLLLVPIDTPGVTVLRSVPVFRHVSSPGECEVDFASVRVPATALLGARARASRRPRLASVPGASTTACGRWAWPIVPWR